MMTCSLRKRDEEDLQSLINRVDDAIHRIRDLRSTGFTLDKLDDELASMTLIRALPDDYNAFVISVAKGRSGQVYCSKCVCARR